MVDLVLAQDPPQMSLAPDEGSVQQPATASPNPAFGDRVHTGRPDIAEHRPDTSVGEDSVERAGEVRSAVADHELDPVRLLTEVHEEVAGLPAAQVWTQCHSYAFDFSVWEIWAALLGGGRLVVVPDSVVRSPEDLHALLVAEQVSVLSQTPSAFYALQTVDAQHWWLTSSTAFARGVTEWLGLPPSLPPESEGQLKLETVVFGGEALEPQRLETWLDNHPGLPRLINMYGITETTVHASFRQIVAGDVDSIARAISDGLAFEAFSAEYIANILEARARTLPEPGPLQLTRGIDLLDIDIPAPDLTVYDGGSHDAE